MASNISLSYHVLVTENLKHTLTLGVSCNHHKGIIAIGIVIQATDRPGRRGEILEKLSEVHPIMADCDRFAILRALQIADERGYTRVVTRSQSSGLRRILKNNYKAGRGADREDLHGKILRLAQNFTEVKFGHVMRRKNVIANSLARQAAGIQRKKRSDREEPMNWWELGVEMEIRRLEEQHLPELEMRDWDDIPF